MTRVSSLGLSACRGRAAGHVLLSAPVHVRTSESEYVLLSVRCVVLPTMIVPIVPGFSVFPMPESPDRGEAGAELSPAARRPITASRQASCQRFCNRCGLGFGSELKHKIQERNGGSGLTAALGTQMARGIRWTTGATFPPLHHRDKWSFHPSVRSNLLYHHRFLEIDCAP